MIIVVEGCDNAGKTTLALDLAKRLRAVFLKVERPARGVDLMAFANLLEVAKSYSGIVVTDRHVAISEPIYGNIIRGGHSLKTEDLALARERIDLVVYCRPPNARIFSTMADREQMEGVIEQGESILCAYDDLFFTPGPRHTRYDYTTMTVDDLLQRIAPLFNPAQRS